MVLEIGADRSRLDNGINSSSRKDFTVTDSRQLEDLGGLNYAGTEDHFTGGFCLVSFARN
jgi:hypothetical protein